MELRPAGEPREPARGGGADDPASAVGGGGRETPSRSQQLDAFHTLLEAFLLVRARLREELARDGGSDWERTALPAALRTRLEERREAEASLAWRPSGDDLLDYAGFAELGELIAAEPGRLAGYAALSKDPAILRTRLHELDAIRERLAFGRLVSARDAEILDVFRERLLRVPAALPSGPEAADASEAKPERRPEIRTGVRAAPDSAPPDPQQPCQPLPAAEEVAGTHAATTAEPAGQQGRPAPTSPPPVSARELSLALERGNDRLVLQALYAEITVAADALWRYLPPGRAGAWEMVSASSWYTDRFATLGLKPVSDFYVLAATVAERIRAGIAADEHQDYLKQHGFAGLLLALRDLFRHALASGS